MAALIASGLSALLGAMVLAGWYVGSETLTKVSAQFVPMQYNTALGFLLCGIAGLLWGTRHRRWVVGLGAAAGTVGLVTLVQYVTGIDAGLDELCMSHPHDAKTSHPGRMAPNTALCFLLAGTALAWGASRRGPDRLRDARTAVLGALVLALGAVALFGYASEVDTAYGWGNLTRMAVHTAVGFVLLGLGLLARAVYSSARDAGPFPAWVPIPIAIAGAALSVCFWQALSARESQHLRADTRRVHTHVRELCAELIASRAHAIERMTARWAAHGGTPRAQWEPDAAHYVETIAGLEVMGWVDPTGTLQWTSPSAASARRDLAEAIARNPLARAATAPVVRSARTPAGRSEMVLYAPLTLDGPKGGALVARMDTQRFLAPSLLRLEPRFAVAIYDGDQPVLESEPSQRVEESVAVEGLLLPDMPWRLVVRPLDETVAAFRTATPLLALVVGMLVSTLLAGIARVAWLHGRRRDEAERLNERLRRSNRELEQFAYVASHDLQEPLRMVASYTQLLASRYKGKLDEEADEFIEFAVDGARRMRVLINDLLVLARVDSRGKPFADVDGNAVARDVLHDLDLAISDANAEVEVSGLPTVQGDAAQLGQLFQNLIENAIRYRSNGTPRVHLSAQRAEDGWQFSVADNGVDIDPKYHDRIFLIFQRLQSHGSGTGIGLALCHKIVDRHGGRIWVESAGEGHGSTFHFTIADRREHT